jgi:D-alanine-D-alanine ligase
MATDPDAPPSTGNVERALGWPVIVKPSKQGSTVGLSIVKQPGELHAAIAEAFKHDDEVMIERFIAGRELSAPVIGGEALPVGEIIPKHEIYDYECKYTPGMAEEIFPAPLSAAETAEVQSQAQRAFTALKLSGCARIDFRMTATGEFYCLEANTLPGMTATSLVPQGAAAAGISFPDLCDRIARLAIDTKPGAARR